MYYWLILICVLLLDQISKWWVSITFNIGESRALIDGLLWLTYVQNKGAAFSIMQGKALFFIISSIIVITAAAYFIIRYHPARGLAAILGLISGGAVGNLIDRIRFGHVIDFFDLHWWPVFNIADIAIVTGGILLIIYFLYEERSVDLNE